MTDTVALLTAAIHECWRDPDGIHPDMDDCQAEAKAILATPSGQRLLAKVDFFEAKIARCNEVVMDLQMAAALPAAPSERERALEAALLPLVEYAEALSHRYAILRQEPPGTSTRLLHDITRTARAALAQPDAQEAKCDPPTTHRYERVGPDMLRCVRCQYQREG